MGKSRYYIVWHHALLLKTEGGANRSWVDLPLARHSFRCAMSAASQHSVLHIAAWIWFEIVKCYQVMLKSCWVIWVFRLNSLQLSDELRPHLRDSPNDPPNATAKVANPMADTAHLLTMPHLRSYWDHKRPKLLFGGRCPFPSCPVSPVSLTQGLRRSQGLFVWQVTWCRIGYISAIKGILRYRTTQYDAKGLTSFNDVELLNGLQLSHVLAAI